VANLKVEGQGDNAGGGKKDTKFISDLMRDFKAEQIKNHLKKIWISELHAYCLENLTDTSKEVMDDLLKFESDCMTLQIVYNSLDIKGLSGKEGQERKKFINNLGYLYPDRDAKLTEVSSFENLKEAVKNTDYEAMLNEVTDLPNKEKQSEFSSAGKSIDDVMLIEKAKKYSMAFENQFHYGVFYAYIKIKEQEIKNIIWLAELVSIGVPKALPGWNKFVLPFKYHREELI